jgi:hypothetical protein
MIPHTYEQWRQCIEHDCGIRLTPDFVQERLAIYADATHTETKRFAELYGDNHLRNIIQWYTQVLK